MSGSIGRVLVVDDDDAVRRLTARILTEGGYRVLTAASGADALALCRPQGARIDLLLSDVVLPGMSGPSLAARLLTPFPRLRVLFTSGHPDSAVVRHGVLDPSTWFIAKPFSAAALCGQVRDILDAGSHDETPGTAGLSAAAPTTIDRGHDALSSD